MPSMSARKDNDKICQRGAGARVRCSDGNVDNETAVQMLALVLDQPNQPQPSGEGWGHALGGGVRAQQPTRERRVLASLVST